MPEEPFVPRKNPEKAASRVAINGVMLASLFVVLTIIFLDPKKFDAFATAQLVLAIPFLYVSSLAYSKIGYWEKTRLWNALGYFTNTIGTLLLINAIGVLVSSISVPLAIVYFGIMILLLLIYSLINVLYNRKTLLEKILKFSFSTAILLAGGLFPVLMLAG